MMLITYSADAFDTIGGIARGNVEQQSSGLLAVVIAADKAVTRRLG